MGKGKHRNGRHNQQAAHVKPADTPAWRLHVEEAKALHPEPPPLEAPEEEILKLRREEYDRHIDLFKFYCDIALKANLYFYLITGGITSFYFNSLSRSSANYSGDNQSPTPMSFIEVSFLLPIFMSGVLGGVFFYGRHLWLEVVDSIGEIRDDLSARGLSIKKTPEVSLLASLLLIFGSLFFLVGGALTLLVAVQMKNSKVWSINNDWDELFRTPKSYLILLPAVVILIAGIFLPFCAPFINWALKRRRERRRRRLIRKWSAKLQKLTLDNPRYPFKDSFLYYRLHPHLSEETNRGIKNGTFPKHHIEQDLEKLKLKWGLGSPDLSPLFESDERA